MLCKAPTRSSPQPRLVAAHDFHEAEVVLRTDEERRRIGVVVGGVIFVAHEDAFRTDHHAEVPVRVVDGAAEEAVVVVPFFGLGAARIERAREETRNPASFGDW